MHSRIFTTLLIAGLASLSGTSIAGAQSPTATGYDETGVVIGVPPTPPAKSESTPTPSTVVTPPLTETPVLPPESTPAQETAGGPVTEESTPLAGETEAPEVAGATATRPASGTGPGSAGNAPVAAPTPAQDLDASGGSLPFTGLDLAFVVLGGLALLAMGVALRRTTRRGTAGI